MKAAAGYFLAALLGVVVGVLVVRPSTAPSPPVRVAAVAQDPEARASEVAQAAAAVGQAVVSIDTSQSVEAETDPLSPDAPSRGMGSGVVISPDGYVLTNNHVVAEARKISVSFSDGDSLDARVVGTDAYTDLAVLKVEGDNLPYAAFGDSDAVEVGQWLVAVGNPYGFGHTVTVGVLSSKGRRLADARVELTDLLQTDAAINPGNSGGPLANLQGEVVGINTAIIPFARGIGFAIPSNTAARVAEQLRKDGRIVRPYLGVGMKPLTKAMQELLELPDTKGVAVTGVHHGGPAHRAGIKEGDVVRSFAGRPVSDMDELKKAVEKTSPGDEVPLELWRSGKSMSVQVEIAEMPERLPTGN